MDLKDRTRWAINYVSAKYKLSNPKIAKRLGVKNDTVNGYRAKLSNPKVDFIVKFCDAFDIDLIWFTKGDGEPFPGAVSKYPEVCSQASYEIARDKGHETGTNEDTATAYDIRPMAGLEQTEENSTEKSFRRLAELAGISIERGWKTNLSNFLGVPIGQISNSILRGKISKNLLGRIGGKGFSAENWVVSEKVDNPPPPPLPDSTIDAEMSFQKLAILAGVRIGQNWLFDLASHIGLDAVGMRKAMSQNQIDENMIRGIEQEGFGRELWVVRKRIARNTSNSRRHPIDTNELMEMAARILESGTSFAETFASNIEIFHAALASEKVTEQQRQDTIE